MRANITMVNNHTVCCTQYIVKPPRCPQSGFAWHRDSDWCSPDVVCEHPGYLSLWCALDDMTAGAVPAVHDLETACTGQAVAITWVTCFLVQMLKLGDMLQKMGACTSGQVLEVQPSTLTCSHPPQEATQCQWKLALQLLWGIDSCIAACPTAATILAEHGCPNSVSSPSCCVILTVLSRLPCLCSRPSAHMRLPAEDSVLSRATCAAHRKESMQFISHMQNQTIVTENRWTNGLLTASVQAFQL